MLISQSSLGPSSGHFPRTFVSIDFASSVGPLNLGQSDVTASAESGEAFACVVSLEDISGKEDESFAELEAHKAKVNMAIALFRDLTVKVIEKGGAKGTRTDLYLCLCSN